MRSPKGRLELTWMGKDMALIPAGLTPGASRHSGRILFGPFIDVGDRQVRLAPQLSNFHVHVDRSPIEYPTHECLEKRRHLEIFWHGVVAKTDRTEVWVVGPVGQHEACRVVRVSLAA